MNKYYYILILFLGFIYISCDSEDAPDCFKKTGDIVDRLVEVPPFHTIKVIDETDIYLSNAPNQEVVIHAGENLIPKIHLEVNGGVLVVSNENSCNWRRSPGNPGIYIGTNNLTHIEIFDYSDFYAPDTLELEQLNIYSDGTGNFDLALNVDSLWIESIYISNFDIRGEVDYLNINLTDDSQFFARDLIASDIQVRHRGSNTVELFPVNTLEGTMESTGNLYYFNEPAVVEISVSGTGQLFNFSGR